MCNDGPFDQGFDIAKCLEDERLIGLSQFEQRLKVSEEDDENLKEREERAFKLKYQDEIKRDLTSMRTDWKRILRTLTP